MRNARLAGLLGAASVLAGCSTSFDGYWVTNTLNGQMISGDGVATLAIHDDHSYSYTVVNGNENVVTAASGIWHEDSQTAIRLIKQEGDGPDVAAATMADGKLEVAATDWTGTFKRQK